MICVIMQPTYLPWLGYFDLYDQADVFVILDTVQFSRQSWQQRNRIQTRQGLQWLTVPVVKKFPQSIQEARISNPLVVRKHIETIIQNYSKAHAFNEYIQAFSEAMDDSLESCFLVKLNCGLIGYFCSVLGIGTKTVFASELGIEGNRSTMLADICKSLGATTYLSPQGSAGYLMEDAQAFLDRSIEVVFHNYEHPVYTQLYPPFLPQASVIDLILNEGPDALQVIRSGHRPVLDFYKMKNIVSSKANAS